MTKQELLEERKKLLAWVNKWHDSYGMALTYGSWMSLPAAVCRNEVAEILGVRPPVFVNRRPPLKKAS